VDEAGIPCAQKLEAVKTSQLGVLEADSGLGKVGFGGGLVYERSLVAKSYSGATAVAKFRMVEAVQYRK